jgi:hypothetical protein
MATPSVKSTYALDVETVRTLEQLARHWGVSKSEALRRAIRTVARPALERHGDALQALDQLQRSLRLTRAQARSWARRVREERRLSSARAEASTA